ncbi:Tim44 domain-containing protein [Propionivibrio dicarboxylicus]|uniref:Predicted lipid-binding transport protein, Tim44 family n=1 Tax=Propionivibrio dicarboxylicus TaxID=83767 RepID=A0A1G8C475_9RHOO|nr:TIM44-like domain-containing protein [Propionivibrio dicarboxylicus]SDH40163.1 Predicted lipid-binding transport protein, Tim44 family [Propionivibrio dicarboxylicus]
MKKAFLAIFALVVALGLSIENAEAARLGGGRSVGMQRQAVTPKPAAPVQQAAPTRPATPATAPAPAATPKRNWLGPIAGLAAGLGIAALLSHFGFGEGLANVVMIALLAMAALVVFRLIFRRPAKAPEEPLQYAGANPGSTPGGEPAYAPPQAAFPGGAGETSGYVPADFDVEGFLRVAKLNFVRLQAANDAGDVRDLDEFLVPALGAEIRRQITERGGDKQQTDVVTLNAELLEVVTEGGQHIASVHFSGMVRERPDAAAEPFSEVWHLAKPTDGSSGWRVAGIQQVS